MAAGACVAALSAAGESAGEAQAVPENPLRVVGKGVVYDGGPGIIAGSCRCKNGDLLVSFNTGGDLSAGQRAGLVRSWDGGRTWGAPETWFDSVFQRGGVEAGCSLTRLAGGRLLLPYADGFYLRPGKSSDRHALLFCPVSDDDGRTWTHRKARDFEGLEAFAFGTVAELPGGTLLLPLWGAYNRQGVWASGVLKSRDAGETWGDWRPITREHGDETPILLLPDGRVLALMRGYTRDPGHPFHVSYSADGGDTWSEPRRIAVNGTSPALHLTPKGRLLAGFRSTLPGGRCHVCASTDSGLTWSAPLELALPAGTWDRGGYPAFENLPDGHIFVTFHNGTPPRWHVLYNLLEEA